MRVIAADKYLLILDLGLWRQAPFLGKLLLNEAKLSSIIFSYANARFHHFIICKTSCRFCNTTFQYHFMPDTPFYKQT